LTIPKKQREAVNRGRTDITMAKKKKDRQYNGQKEEGQTLQWPKRRTKEQTIIYKILHRKLKTEQHESL
jgi:hypothetical protein